MQETCKQFRSEFMEFSIQRYFWLTFLRCFAVFLLNIWSLLIETHFIHSLTQTFPLCGAHAFFGPKEPSHCSGSECDGVSPGAVCSGQGGMPSLQAVLQAGPVRDGKEKRNSTDPAMARKARLQTADLSVSSTLSFLSWADRLHGCAQRTYCLRLPVSMSERQGRLQGC